MCAICSQRNKIERELTYQMGGEQKAGDSAAVQEESERKRDRGRERAHYSLMQAGDDTVYRYLYAEIVNICKSVHTKTSD